MTGYQVEGNIYTGIIPCPQPYTWLRSRNTTNANLVGYAVPGLGWSYYYYGSYLAPIFRLV